MKRSILSIILLITFSIPSVYADHLQQILRLAGGIILTVVSTKLGLEGLGTVIETVPKEVMLTNSSSVIKYFLTAAATTTGAAYCWYNLLEDPLPKGGVTTSLAREDTVTLRYNVAGLIENNKTFK